MKHLGYSLYVIALAIVAFVTEEIITFIMLGMILLALTNIHSILTKIYLQNQDKQ